MSAFFAFLFSFSLSFVFVKFIPHRFPSDKPNERKIHRFAVPLTGGISIFGSYIIFVRDPRLLAASCLVFALGLLDDIEELTYKSKLPFQMLIAIIAAFFLLPQEIRIFGLSTGSVGLFLAPVWMIAMINAVNMIDGLDGLAGGSLMIASFILNQRILGAVIGGFLPFNLPPAKTFLGNSGSMFLGFAVPLAAITAFKGDLGYATLFLGYPAYEVISSFSRRVIARRNPFKADKEHTHHVLLARLGIKKTLLILLSFSFICNLIGLTEKFWTLFLYLLLGSVLFFYCRLQR